MLRMMLLAAVAAALSACGRSLPKYEKPVARAQFQTIRTTAYTHTEADHIVHGRRTCQGTPLRYGAVSSAAADWSRWPAGTIFRIQQTGEIYEVDDIGWALSGRNTLDLYKPTRDAMNQWGARIVDIEILRWGDDAESLEFLRKRKHHAHCRRMFNDLEKRIASGAKNPAPVTVAASLPTAPATPQTVLASPAGQGGLRQRSL